MSGGRGRCLLQLWEGLVKLIYLGSSWLCSASADKVLQGISGEFFPFCLPSQMFYIMQLEESVAPLPSKHIQTYFSHCDHMGHLTQSLLLRQFPFV